MFLIFLFSALSLSIDANEAAKSTQPTETGMSLNENTEKSQQTQIKNDIPIPPTHTKPPSSSTQIISTPKEIIKPTEATKPEIPKNRPEIISDKSENKEKPVTLPTPNVIQKSPEPVVVKEKEETRPTPNVIQKSPEPLN